jgi:hypothetical protein
MSSRYLTELLNKVHAIVKCGAGTFKEMAHDTGATLSQCYDWVNARRMDPSGANAMKLHEWAERKTTQIAAAGETDAPGRKLHRLYREHYKRATSLFPGSGKD